MAQPDHPITIEDRIGHSFVYVSVRIETEQVDEFAQEIEGVIHTLRGRILDMKAIPIESTKGVPR